MTDAGPVRIFTPPNTLKRKVGDGAPEMPAAVVPTFEELMRASNRGYAEHLARQLHDLRTLTVAGDTPPPVAAIFTIAHQIRGEAQHFGYACVGCIADSLCKFIEASGQTTTPAQAVLNLHVDAMTVLKNDSDAHGEGAVKQNAQVLSLEIARAVKHVLRHCDGHACPDAGGHCGHAKT